VVRLVAELVKAPPLRGVAGPASAPRSASEGPRGARRATPQWLAESARINRHPDRMIQARSFSGRVAARSNWALRHYGTQDGYAGVRPAGL
jgi:hypothetical protein